MKGINSFTPWQIHWLQRGADCDGGPAGAPSAWGALPEHPRPAVRGLRRVAEEPRCQGQFNSKNREGGVRPMRGRLSARNWGVSAAGQPLSLQSLRWQAEGGPPWCQPATEWEWVFGQEPSAPRPPVVVHPALAPRLRVGLYLRKQLLLRGLSTVPPDGCGSPACPARPPGRVGFLGAGSWSVALPGVLSVERREWD